MKGGVGLERMPWGPSWANAVSFRLGVIAYNLFIGFKRLACPAAWAQQIIATVRWQLVQLAAPDPLNPGSPGERGLAMPAQGSIPLATA